ncbi:glycosyltransferase [Parachlamydia sp. AcF125]|uniref:glycosyltransferase n=1 Tax=Parachlamydia sp. AcF125 TaxID=2795736 RepID=UPI001BD893C1|nr:glycosyltransferase [Parachlamydia sp. AcF125]MBS4167835.1 putative teichuronic acid biosynthesis glycosyltransferase TuaC [Parachlamydia sp. AcF125]
MPLHVLWLPSWYPIEENPLKGIFFQEQAKALYQEGVNVGVIYPEVRPLRDWKWAQGLKNYFQSSFAIEDHIPTYRRHGWNLFPKMIKQQMRFWIAQADSLMKRYVAKQGLPALIHAHSVLWGGIAAQVLSKKWKIPYVVTEHFTGILKEKPFSTGLEDCWSKPYIREAYRHATYVFSVGRALKVVIEKCAGREVQVLPNCFDADFFTLASQEKKRSPFRFFCLAHLTANKNYPLLLKAFQLAYQHNPHICLEIGGAGELKKGLEQMARDYKIASAVHFLGPLSRGEVLKAMHRANAFVLPSNFETFGVVLIEALATGLPLIATRCGGPEDIVTEDVGILVPLNDSQALAEAMKNIQYNCYEPEVLRNSAINRFSRQVVTQKLIQFYRFTSSGSNHEYPCHL